ncbi:MAG TPA: PIN domain-containing protein [Candidatus Acidoferrum sp.]|nr:PIN domain-containing protein [Candidatus Acidoferrum sp.]
MEECEEVLRRPRFGLEPRRITRWTRELRKRARMVNPGKAVKVTKDPDDNKVLECALEAPADYVMTGNVRHFPARYQDIRVVTPREFMTILAAEPSKI